MMRHHRWIPVAICLLAVSTVCRGDAKFLTKDDIDQTIALLQPPPTEGSPEQQAEIAELLEMQKQRTPDDVTRVKLHANLSGFSFSEVLGAWFDRKDLPATGHLMDEAGAEAKAVVSKAKKQFTRRRPFVADARIHPALPETGFSYPSGHATAGMLYADVLAEVFPEHKDALIALGEKIGEDREEAGVHYPSDVAAGQKIGAEIAKRLLANPHFHEDLEKAIAEVHADASAK